MGERNASAEKIRSELVVLQARAQTAGLSFLAYLIAMAVIEAATEAKK